jgi:succinate dehydrogenase/fumarate reductase flavoprotein subunit
LEGLVFGLRLADRLAGRNDEKTGASSRQALTVMVYDDLSEEEALLSARPDRETMLQMRREIRQVMWKYVSLQRDRQGLLEATRQLHNLRTSMTTNGSTHHSILVEWRETVNMLKVAELVIAAALQRRESRGSHSRLDYPAQSDMLTGRHYVFQPVLAPQGGRKGAPLQYCAENRDSSMVSEREEVTFNG